MDEMNLVQKRFQVVMWKDLFVLADDGSGTIKDYVELDRMRAAQVARFPEGIAIVCIIPENATPPPNDVRAQIGRSLDDMAATVKGFVWVVEGSGFRAAACRGALVGMQLFSRRPYPTHVTTNVRTAIAWSLPHLEGGVSRLPEVPQALLAIDRERQKIHGFERFAVAC